jgi:AraC family transcriptional regulator of adaptative response / DNA-3-methyladenine glycosylase II
MRLPYRPPFNWAALATFLKSRATPGVEVVEQNSYQRTVESDGGGGVIDVRPDPESTCLIVRIALPKYRGLLRVVERVRRIFDLAADPLQIASRLSNDSRLKTLLAVQPGLRVPGVWDGFEIAVRAVLGQSLTTVDSAVVAGRLVQTFGRAIETPIEGLTHLFPRPEDLAEAELAPLGIARQSAASIQGLARMVRDQEFTFESSRTLQETVSRLRAIEGVGEEMAQYIAMRACGEPDAFPWPEGLRIAAEDWRPWRAYAAMHLFMTGGLQGGIQGEPGFEVC